MHLFTWIKWAKVRSAAIKANTALVSCNGKGVQIVWQKQDDVWRQND